jgi:hypothetical protein
MKRKEPHSFRTARHKVPKRVTDIDDLDKCVIRLTIHEFYVQVKTSPTVSKLFPKLTDRINFNDGDTSLRNIVKELGFLWKKTRNNRVVLIEKLYVGCMQISYLTALNMYREGRPRMRRTYTVAILDQRAGVMIVHWVCLHQSWKGKDSSFSMREATVVLFTTHKLSSDRTRKTGDYHNEMNG